MRPIFLFAISTTLLVACDNALEPNAARTAAGGALARTTGIVATDLGTLAGESYASKINAVGQIIGQSITSPNFGQRAWRWENGALTDLGSFGGNVTWATAINDRSDIIGYSATARMTDSGLVDNGLRAFVWRNGVMTALSAFGSTNTKANALNNLGQIAGAAFVPPFDLLAVTWQNGVATALPSLGGSSSIANDINDAGESVGWSQLPQVMGDTGLMNGDTHAVLWRNGVAIDLGTLGGTYSEAIFINGVGDIVGVSAMATGQYFHAFVWRNGVMTDLGSLGGDWAWPFAINDLGQIVGEAGTPAGNGHAFLWENGVMTDLGTLGGAFSTARAINANGQIAGVAEDAAGAWRAYLWDAGVMIDLGANGGVSSEGNDIGPDGDVVGLTLDASSAMRATLWSEGKVEKAKKEKEKKEKKEKEKKEKEKKEKEKKGK